jgi:2-dehydropantoate 2-reductase
MSDGLTAAVVGGGALGLIYAAALARPDSPTLLVTRRRALVDAIAAGDVHVELEGNLLRTGPDAIVATPPEDADAHGPRDVVLVLARTFESDYAVTVAESLAGSNGIVVMLQNGLTGWDFARRATSANVSGASYIAAWTSKDREAVCKRVGPTVLPAEGHRMRSEHAEAIRALFARARLPLETAGRECDVVWRKVAVTSTTWLCAALGLPVDLVRASDAWEDAVSPLLREIAAVARAAGATVDAAEIVAMVGALPSAPGSKGSAYSSLERGGRLEVVEICESIARRGDAAGVEVPCTRLVASLARIQEQSFAELPRVSR